MAQKSGVHSRFTDLFIHRYAEFGDAIRKLGLGKKYSTEQRMKIAEFIDQDKNGVIDW